MNTFVKKCTAENEIKLRRDMIKKIKRTKVSTSPPKLIKPDGPGICGISGLIHPISLSN